MRLSPRNDPFVIWLRFKTMVVIDRHGRHWMPVFGTDGEIVEWTHAQVAYGRLLELCQELRGPSW